MRYKDREKIKKRINDDIDEIKEFDEVDYFINANFRQFLTHGEYDDNSMELNYQYEMLKEIESDKRFMDKLNFVLEKYVRLNK